MSEKQEDLTIMDAGHRVEIVAGHRKGERGTVAEVRELKCKSGFIYNFNILVHPDNLPKTAIPIPFDVSEVRRIPTQRKVSGLCK